VGRWGGVDPFLEKHFDFNPYNYVLDNPLNLIDPDGKQSFALKLFQQAIKNAGRTETKIIDIPITPLDVFLYVITGDIGVNDVKESQSIFVQGVEGYLEYDQLVNGIDFSVLESRNNTIKDIIVGKMEPVEKHLDLLEGKKSKYEGPLHKRDEEKWKKDLQRNWKQAKEKATKLGKSISQVLRERGWSSEKISKLIDRVKSQGIDP